ncbi:hypothetical protein RUM44_000364 [Polyplax serrata]|uniref:Small ribosomal subunit protein mS39 n=1 Tax=Polyplax serrata TaxID=468196 RepID=A0ABR1B845_POLSC
MVGKLDRLRVGLLLSPVIKCTFTNYCTATESWLRLNIPKRIERGPLDILQAIAKTVKRDPTAHHYKYPDDPYFESKTNFSKRTLALSLESGRKSARWIVENNPQYFKEVISEPFIKSYAPKPQYNEDSDVSEQTLVQVINERNVSDAIFIYELLKKKGCDLSEETKQILLELVCYYNEHDREDENNLEAKWYSVETTAKETWKNEGFAQTLFSTMNVDCPLALSTLIQGMLRFGQIDRAVELYKVAIDKNIVLSVGVYNGMFSNVKGIVTHQRWNYIVNLLKEMDSKEVKPDLFTLNAVLLLLSNCTEIHKRITKARSIIQEFRKLGIEPSLASFCYLLNIAVQELSNDKAQLRHIFGNTLQFLSGQSFELVHPDDVNFFPQAMNIIDSHVRSSNLAHKLYKLLLEGNNIKFLAKNIDQNNFYKNYLFLILRGEPIECFIKLYKDVVPTVFIPTTNLFKSILAHLKRLEELTVLPLLWADIKNLPIAAGLDLSCTIVKMVEIYEGGDKKVTETFLEVANYIYETTNHSENLKNTELTGEIISNLLIIFLKFGDPQKGLELLEMYEGSGVLLCSLSHPALTALFDYHLMHSKPPHILECLRKAKQNSHPNIKELATKALPHLSVLQNTDLKWITDIIEKSEEKSEESQPKTDDEA